MATRVRPPETTQESRTSPTSLPPEVIDALLVHPETRALHHCRVRVTDDGLSLTRMSGDPEATADRASPESAATEIEWRSLRGFSADESFTTSGGRRLQVLGIETEEGVLTLLASVTEVSRLFGSVGARAERWRRSRKRRLVRQVA